MKRKHFNAKEAVSVLREFEASGQTVEIFCREKEVSPASFYRWQKKYGDLSETDAVRLKELEVENRRLKKLLVERDLEVCVMKEVISKKW